MLQWRTPSACCLEMKDKKVSRTTWVMLLALSTGFMLSQAYRTVAAMMATQLQAEFSLSPQQLGLFAGAFHFAFGAMQLFMGVGIDLHGVRRTMLTAFPLASPATACWCSARY
jgi:sugar phosphate permease